MARRRAHLAILAAVFAAAFVARLLPVLRGGGLRFYGRYDDGVYYAAAASLSFGRVPYRDFVLLHPPGIAIALLPFTVLGRLTSDPTGMTAARLTFMAVGGINSVLVALIASRWGWGRAAIAGLLYVGSAAAVYDEQTTFIEPLATLFTLVAVLALYRRGPRSAARLEIVAGVTLGLACCMKIWYPPILLALVAVALARREIRAAVRVLAAGALTAGVVLVPFFLLAPGPMWTMVVKDQLGRPASHDRLGRIALMVGSHQLARRGDATTIAVVTAAIVVLLLIAVAFCVADPDTWMIGALGVVSAAILMASPSYFGHYGALLSAPSALILAVGLGKALRLLPAARARLVISTAAACLVIAAGLPVALSRTGAAFPAQAFDAVAPAGCISSDDPAGLIQMNRLSQGLRSRCDVPVDVTGSSYGTALPRAVDPVFQTWLMHLLTRSNAFVVLRARGDPLSPAEERTIRRHRPLATEDGLALRLGNSQRHWKGPGGRLRPRSLAASPRRGTPARATAPG